MELYELILHFPKLGDEGITLKSTEYYDSEEEAIARAKVVANSFAVPVPDYYYLADGANTTIWTDYPEEVKKSIHYDIVTSKPTIKAMTTK